MPNKFDLIPNQADRAKMEDLYQAITHTNNWDVIERVDPKDLARTPEINQILGAMKHPELFSGAGLMLGFYYMKDLKRLGYVS
jgi:hypothetical protein